VVLIVSHLVMSMFCCCSVCGRHECLSQTDSLIFSLLLFFVVIILIEEQTIINFRQIISIIFYYLLNKIRLKFHNLPH
jgi:hypothetical protein